MENDEKTEIAGKIPWKLYIGTVAFVHYLLVDPAYQGRHIGDALMKQLMCSFENHLYVKVMLSDPKTIAFYERYGFRQYDNYSAMVRKHFL